MVSLISLLVIAMVMVSITGTHANQQLGGKHILPTLRFYFAITIPMVWLVSDFNVGHCTAL